MTRSLTHRHGFITLLAIVCTAALFQNAKAEKPQKPRIVQVAMCQIVALDSDREGNFIRAEAAIKEAKEKGAQIVCLPETTILGWVNPEAHKRAYPIPGKDSDRLAALAKKYDVYLCVGLSEKDGENLHDSVVLIDPKGVILMKHRKINILTSWMTPPYTPGSEVNVVQTPFGTIGMLICADTFKESICHRMAELKPELVLVPYGWAAKEHQWPKHGENLKKVVSRAAQWIGAPVVGTDLVGQISHGINRGLIYGGASVAVDPDGKVLAQGKDRQSDVIVFPVEVGRKPAKPAEADSK